MKVRRCMSDHRADQFQKWLKTNGRKPANVRFPKTNAAWWPQVTANSVDFDDFYRSMTYTARP